MRVRKVWIVLVAMLLSSAASAEPPSAPSAGSAPAPSSSSSQPRLELTVDKSKVDLKGHKLEAKASRELSKMTLKVIGESGAVLAQDELRFPGSPPGTALVVTWTPSSDETVARIELVAHDRVGYWAGIAVIPWAASIPHEEVRFRRDSADIDDSEKPKLEASYAKISEVWTRHRDLGKIILFIAGHTDTVGREDYNLRLSQRRAQAIAGWFRQRGLKIPIAYEGFGETSLLVGTADEVDEPRNRRVDYILSLDEPAFKTTGFRPVWKRVN